MTGLAQSARVAALLPADTPLADRQSIGWAIFADVLCGLNQPEPTVLSWPCSECGQFEIVCDCTEADILADLEDTHRSDCLARYREDIFGDGK